MTKNWSVGIALFLLACPVYALVWLVRLARGLAFVRLAGRRGLTCRTCGETILLVGFWRCACGFTYRGQLLQLCPVCGTLPELIHCEHCGATERV